MRAPRALEVGQVPRDGADRAPDAVALGHHPLGHPEAQARQREEMEQAPGRSAARHRDALVVIAAAARNGPLTVHRRDGLAHVPSRRAARDGAPAGKLACRLAGYRLA